MNTMTARQIAMKGADGAPLLLEKVDVRGSVHATLARVTMRQAYRNDTGSNVEAIYTFPLPPSAVLLRTVVELGGKRYEGTVVAKAAAERTYEDAIAEGDTAIMVERPEPGLYTMNVGNLMAGESATVEIEFAQLLDWSHGRLRLALPMTIAPRYGEEKSALEAHAKPHIGILVERAFRLELRVAVKGSVSSPSHPIATGADGGDLVVSLARESAWMDRDFVLVVQAARAPESFATIAQDGDSQVGYASFQIPEADADATGHDVRIVVDCSGSMAGDSIALARSGAINLLNRLRDVDRFAIVAFGSTTRAFRAEIKGATQANVEAAIAWVQALEADMGGTELASALEAAMASRGSRDGGDIFLVTDGQVGESERTINRARHLMHRVFVVAIGVSPSRGFLEGVVEATHGAIDYIAPGEDVADAIGRQFARATQMPVSELSVDWGPDLAPKWSVGTGTGRAYCGDTIHAFCDLGSSPRSVHVAYRVADRPGASFEVPCALVPAEIAGAMPRMAADQRIREGLRSGAMDQSAAEALAVKHQLVTSLTHYVLVIDRGEKKAGEMPTVAPVPTMLAAGWGGTGRAASYMAAPAAARDAMFGSSMEMLSIRDSDVSYSRQSVRRESAAPFVKESNARFGSLFATGTLPLTLGAARGMMLPDSIVELLETLIAEGRSEEEVMRAFWAAFAMFLDPAATKRGLARKLRAASGQADRGLVQAILAELRALEVTP